MKSKATVKIVLDRKHKGDEKLMLVRITYNRKYREYSIGDDTIRLTKEQFDNPRLAKTKDAMVVANKALRVAEEVIEELGADFTFDAFKTQYKTRLTGRYSISCSFDSLLPDYFNEHNSSYKTKKSYHTAVNWVLRYKKNATLTAMTSDFVEGLISFMKNEHFNEHDCEISENTLRMYLRQLRAIYNYAINKGYTNKKNPFAIKGLGSIKRQKAALSAEELNKFLEYTPKNKQEEFGKDFFLLTLHCYGANLKDILLLKNSNIENDIVTFKRNKTKKTGIETQFKLTGIAKNLFNKYGKISPSKPNSLILPYLVGVHSDANLENRKKRQERKINKGLKSISKALNMRKITTYNARHTIATVLMINDMTAEQIQKLLGHSSSKTTQIYLGSLSLDILDKSKDILENLGKKQ